MSDIIERIVIGGTTDARVSDYGPCYGTRGALTSIGRDKVQCHICGKGFRNLGLHVRLTHEMTPRSYRTEFGLGAEVGLVSEALHDRFSIVHGPRLLVGCKDANEKAVIAIKACMLDPEWKHQRAINSSQQQGGRSYLVRSCVICGTQFKCPKNSKRLTCKGLTSPCDAERRRRSILGRKHTDEAIEKMRGARSEKLSMICPSCEAPYETNVSRPKATCGRPECYKKAISRWHTGRKLNWEAKHKISQKAKARYAARAS